MTSPPLSHAIRYSTVILANGELPRHEVPLKLLKEAKEIICCDGAVHNLLTLGFSPTAIVGDGDSISPEERERFRDILFLDTDREYNDLNKALSFSLRNGAGKAAILGGFGLREDHALGNLGVMMLFAKERNMELEMVTNHGVFTPLLETATLACYPGQQVSVFALYGDPELTFYGLKYPVDRRKFRYLWEGSLNEAVSNRFTIEFDKGDILVYRSY